MCICWYIIPFCCKAQGHIRRGKLFSLIMMIQKTFLVFCININRKNLVMWIWKGEKIIMLCSLLFLIFHRISDQAVQVRFPCYSRDFVISPCIIFGWHILISRQFSVNYQKCLNDFGQAGFDLHLYMRSFVVLFINSIVTVGSFKKYILIQPVLKMM